VTARATKKHLQKSFSLNKRQALGGTTLLHKALSRIYSPFVYMCARTAGQKRPVRLPGSLHTHTLTLQLDTSHIRFRKIKYRFTSACVAARAKKHLQKSFSLNKRQALGHNTFAQSVESYLFAVCLHVRAHRWTITSGTFARPTAHTHVNTTTRYIPRQIPENKIPLYFGVVAAQAKKHLQKSFHQPDCNPTPPATPRHAMPAQPNPTQLSPAQPSPAQQPSPTQSQPGGEEGGR
jgi:hypothetical protein